MDRADRGPGSGEPQDPPVFTHRDFEHLSRAIRDLTRSITDLRTEMASTYARKDVVEPRFEDIETDIKKHDSHWEWLVRLVIGAVILALLGLLFVQTGDVR